jgi:hypothetical protein
VLPRSDHRRDRGVFGTEAGARGSVDADAGEDSSLVSHQRCRDIGEQSTGDLMGIELTRRNGDELLRRDLDHAVRR